MYVCVDHVCDCEKSLLSDAQPSRVARSIALSPPMPKREARNEVLSSDCH